MSLLWVKAAARDYEAIHSAIDEHAHDLHGHTGIAGNSPDLGKDAEFDAAYEHAGTCKNRVCQPVFRRLRFTETTFRGNKKDIDPEKVKSLTKNPSKGSLPIVMKLRGEHHILDGDHRIFSHVMRGDSETPALVHDGDSFLENPHQ